MKFKVTSIVGEDVSALLREVSVRLEDTFNEILGDGDFGDEIDELVLVAVSVFEEDAENLKWIKAHNRLGTYKDGKTRQSIKYLSLAISILPSNLTKLKASEALSLVCRSFKTKLKTRPPRLAKGLDFDRLSKAVSQVLDIYI